jgi:hypothetical protein
MNLIDRIPIVGLAALAVMMGLAPFSPQPHLVEKFYMLLAGTLTRPVDIFDVLWHLLPTILLVTRLYRARKADLNKNSQ